MGILTENSVYGVIRASRSTFRNSHDKIAFAIHASFMASGFHLHATGPRAFSDDALQSSSSEEVGIENWNQYDGYYGFVYSNPAQSGKKIIVKALVMGEKLMVDALRGGDSEPVHLEINVDDYVLEKEENHRYFKNFGKLVGDIEKELVNKYDGPSATTSSNKKLQLRNKQVDKNKQKAAKPGVEIRDSRDPSSAWPPQGYVVPPVPAFGFDDTSPGPGIGMYPTRGGSGGSSGDMHIGPHDPRFGLDHDFGIHRGPLRGIPPGARFDPFGPPGVPGFEPGRFIRDPRRPGRGGDGGDGDGVHPDLQQFRHDSDFI